MRAVVYTTTDPDVPPFYQAAARILLPRGVHPVIFHGPDPETLRARATAWWEAEVEKECRRREGPKRKPS